MINILVTAIVDCSMIFEIHILDLVLSSNEGDNDDVRVNHCHDEHMPAHGLTLGRQLFRPFSALLQHAPPCYVIHTPPSYIILGALLYLISKDTQGTPYDRGG